jgi:hypothetical protein
MKRFILFLLLSTLGVFAQVNVNGILDEPEYRSLGEKQSNNQGFGPDIDVSQILYYPDGTNNVLCIGIVGKLNTASNDGIGVWLNVTAQTGAAAR